MAAQGRLVESREDLMMKQYVIDQLREHDFLALEAHLNDHAEGGELPGIYWVPIPRELYEPTQSGHTDCHPFYFAISLDRRAISFELLHRRHRAVLKVTPIIITARGSLGTWYDRFILYEPLAAHALSFPCFSGLRELLGFAEWGSFLHNVQLTAALIDRLTENSYVSI